MFSPPTLPSAAPPSSGFVYVYFLVISPPNTGLELNDPEVKSGLFFRRSQPGALLQLYFDDHFTKWLWSFPHVLLYM